MGEFPPLPPFINPFPPTQIILDFPFPFKPPPAPHSNKANGEPCWERFPPDPLEPPACDPFRVVWPGSPSCKFPGCATPPPPPPAIINGTSAEEVINVPPPPPPGNGEPIFPEQPVCPTRILSTSPRVRTKVALT